MIRSSRTRCVGFIICVLLIAMATPVLAATITTFNVTGAGTAFDQGTKAGPINPSGVVAGFYIDSGGVYHGFVRSAGGTITTFDAPGAGSELEGGTLSEGDINDAGTSTGPYTDSGLVFHGLVRAADGTITSFDAPGAGTGVRQGTIPRWINTSGAIVGRYADSGGVVHGFVRSAGGTITTIDVTGAGTSKGEGTFASSINDSGVIAGLYVDAGGSAHGYVRAANGTITTFDAPGAGTGISQGTEAGVFDTAGDIGGHYSDSGGVFHGFLRSPSGTITTFNAPGAGTSKGQGTFFDGMNGSGIIVGYYADAGGVKHGYERAVDGTFTTIDVPGSGTSINQGTEAAGINASGEIAGHYIDSGGVKHGYVRSGSTGTSQTISFSTIPTKTYGDPAFTLTATATSGLPVSFAVTAGPANLSGSKLTITGSGSVTVQATQAGNSTFAPAPPVPQTFAVDPALLMATGNNAAVAFGAAIPALTGTLTGVVTGDGITASFSTTAVTGSPLGTYLVTPVLHDPSARLGNYDVTLADGALTIYSASGPPLTLWLSPTGATAGGTGYTLTLNGANFAANAKVLWNDALLATTFVNSGQLTASVPASFLAAEGTALITVSNPAPNAATSAAQPIAVASATPVAKVVSASLADAGDGSGNHTLTLTGREFVSGSVAEWNGASLVTKYVSPWQISAIVTAPENSVRPAQLTVVNTAGTSDVFTIR